MSRIKHYCLGLLFDPQFKFVVLIEKEKPAWQFGRLNGAGGKLEKGESPIQAMRREFREETGLQVPYWRYVCKFTVPTEPLECVHLFAMSSPNYKDVKTTTLEKVKIIWCEHLHSEPVLENLLFLVPMSVVALKNFRKWTFLSIHQNFKPGNPRIALKYEPKMARS